MRVSAVKAIAFIVLICIISGASVSRALPDYGEEPAPVSPVGLNISDLTAEDLWGEMTEGNLFSGYELTLMPLWVTWSGASDACMRSLEQQKESLLLQSINCLGLYYESEQFPVSIGRKYYNEKGYTMYSITNRKAPLLKVLFARTNAEIPIIYVVDRYGKVRGFISGYVSNAELTQFLKHFRSDCNTVTFIDGADGSVIYQTIVVDGGYTYYPNVPEHEGYKFKFWNKPVVNITADTIVIAVYDRIGDCNFDGKINTGDAALILKYAVGRAYLSDYALDIADYNRSGETNTGDAVAILQAVASA